MLCESGVSSKVEKKKSKKQKKHQGTPTKGMAQASKGLLCSGWKGWEL